MTAFGARLVCVRQYGGIPDIMAIRLGSTVINCADIETMTRFWAGALDLRPSSTAPGDEFRVLSGSTTNLSLQRSRTPVTARDQMHVDLYTDEQQAQVERLVRLGARVVRHVTDDPSDDYVIMTDPEDNLFCVCAKPRSVAAEAADPAVTL